MQTVDVIFKKPFNAIPTIVCTLKSGSNITTYGDLTAFVDYGSVTKKGFTIKVSNSCATLGAKPCVSWIATVLWNSKSFAEHNVEVSVSNCTVTIKIPELGSYDICTLFIIVQVGNNCYLSIQINHATSYSSAVVSLQGTNIITSSYTWNGGTKVFSIQMNKDYKDIRVSKCYAIK